MVYHSSGDGGSDPSEIRGSDGCQGTLVKAGGRQHREDQARSVESPVRVTRGSVGRPWNGRCVCSKGC